MGSGKDPRLSAWAHTGPAGIQIDWSLGTLMTQRDTSHDLDKGQNPTITNAPHFSFFQSLSIGKMGKCN